MKVRLPIDRITSRIPDLHASIGSTHEHWLNAAKAICTTDTFPKLVSRTFTLPSHPETQYSLAGMTKGAGMIHPNMATLLSVICTDVAVTPAALHSLLQTATAISFNSITIDGDTSTNDTVNLFANGAASPSGTEAIDVATDPSSSAPLPLQSQSEDYQSLSATLNTFLTDLAKLIVRDGEGATKFVTIRVTGALSNNLAKQVAESIARSPLVKTALYGKDANWGRILCATGYSSARDSVCPEFTSVSFVPADGSEELSLLKRGEPEAVDEERAKVILEMEDLEIWVRLDDGAEKEAVEKWARGYEERAEVKLDRAAVGKGEAVVWTCDFSHEYVTINGDYRT